jgi:hypothetical protein
MVGKRFMVGILLRSHQRSHCVTYQAIHKIDYSHTRYPQHGYESWRPALLVSLNALIEECNVTRAAGRLHLSQPAMSAQLARLRTLFDDALLVPSESGRGMVPTPRALALANHCARRCASSGMFQTPLLI